VYTCTCTKVHTN